MDQLVFGKLGDIAILHDLNHAPTASPDKRILPDADYSF